MVNLLAGFGDEQPRQPVNLLAELPAAPQPTAIGRPGRVQRQSAQQDVTAQQLAQLEAGEITSADLSPQEVERVRLARLEAIPELGQAGLGVEAGLGTGALGVTTFDPAEFGRILTEQFPQIGVVTTPEGEQIAVNNETGATVSLNKPGVSPVDVVQGLGVVAAFTPGARVAATAPQALGRFIGRGVAAPTAVRAGAQAFGAAGTEAAIQAAQAGAGGEFDPEEVALAGALGVAGELIPGAAQAGAQRIRAAVGGAEETTEQAARRAALEAEGIEPTRAQVTRDTGEFQLQQEAAKTTGPVRARLEQQEARLQGAFEQRALDTEGNVITSTSTPIDEVLERSISADQKASDLYTQARAIIPTDKNVETKRLNQVFNKNKGFETKSAGVLSAVKAILKNKGVLAKPTKSVTAEGLVRKARPTITVSSAEDVRQQLNGLFKDANFTGKRIIREAKAALDDDVFEAAGDDFFKSARKEVQTFQEGLERAKISKFDSRKNNLVRDMLENKVSPDAFVNDVVFAKKWRAEDIDQLKSYLNQTESGKQAWNDLRAQAIDEIKTRSFIGPVREDGVTQSLSKAGLNKVINKLGDKMSVLFTSEEKQFFTRMQQVAKLREPTPGTFTGKGPSAQAISQAKTRFPGIGPIIESLSEFKQNRLLLRLPKKPRAPRRQRKLPPQTAQALRTDEEK